MENEKINIGLDIGTNSVGWAVTDDKYKIKRFKGNLMWGVHLFDEAKQASERRVFRTARRRLDRKKQRITLLQEFFAKDILEVDKDFFFRLKESALLPEDSEHRSGNIFFDDEDYTDKEYFKEYPTIHHLICELMNDPSYHDVRLVYYACAFILTHRGHFLFPVRKDDIESVRDFVPIYDAFYSNLEGLCECVPFDKNAEAFKKILNMRGSIGNRVSAFNELLFGGKAPKTIDDCPLRFDLLIKLISGGTLKLSDLFGSEAYKELDNDSVCIKTADFTDKLESLCGQIDETHYDLIASVKSLYEWSLLNDILSSHGDSADSDNIMISDAKVRIYEEHKNDLKLLKYYIKKYLTRKDYDEIFRNADNKSNYAAYVYNTKNVPENKVSSNFRTAKEHKSQPDFCKFVSDYLEKIVPDENDREGFEKLKTKCAEQKLCPKQVTTDNRVIPYQLYYAELKKILENASGYLPFLNEKDEYGTVADKILKIMEFRIPYYAGPLVNSEKSKFAWLERKSEAAGKIYPWNFDDMVDKDKTEERFIRRMTCKCTYLAGEDVLPKYSLLNCKFNVLNEINSIKINGEPISPQLKQRLFEDKFRNSKARVTKKSIAEYFRTIGAYSGDIVVSGVDDNIKSTLRSYHDFKRYIESGKLTEADAERIIERITATTDIRRLKKWLKQFKDLTAEDIKAISKFKYNDYGRLSRKLLEQLISVDEKTGEVICEKNIITMLWETNENLMKLLSSNYGYSVSVEAHNREFYGKPENVKGLDERLKDMYIPSAVRRSVTRTLDVVKELKATLKRSPDRIFIEMARGDGGTPKGKRTKSRREMISALLDGVKDNVDELKRHLEGCDDGKLRSEKYYLYFTQLGRSMYSGKPISFEDLEDDHKWNIDHIWPQAKIKDDSLDNKVLVSSEENGRKEDKYPLNYVDKNWQNNMLGFWKMLKKNGLISEKKFERLARTSPFSEEELADFIARQLVETRQSTKAVATLLKELFPETEIVYVKAGLVSEFRQEMDMLKCREINDLHHAKDAYLNIVIGNVYNTKFTKDPLRFIRSGERYSVKMFKKDQNGKESGLMTKPVQRGGETAWDPDTSFAIIRSMMSKNSIRYVRYAYRRKGGLFNQMPERKKPGLIPRKVGLDTEKYGGYNNATCSTFSVVKCKNDVVIIPVELICYSKFFNDIDFAREYAYKKLEYIYTSKKYNSISADDISFPEIKMNNSQDVRSSEIKINSIVEVNGYPLMLCAKDSGGKYITVASAVSLVVSHFDELYIRMILRYLQKYPDDRAIGYSSITKEQNNRIYDLIIEKCGSRPFNQWNMFAEICTVLMDKRDVFRNLSIFEQIKALKETVSILKSGRSGVCDLSLIGAKNTCKSRLGAKITGNKKIKSFHILDQSPTGLYEKRSVNLLEL